MDVIIEFENIGNIKGTRKYVLANKNINIIEAPNRWGKSTFVKAVSLCLSTPLKSYEMTEIAKKMGIVSRTSNSPNPLVNINSNHAKIVVNFDSIISEIKLNKYNILTKKGVGDERFLMTSILNRSSELLNRLISADTNLSWLIKILSISWKYDSILEILGKYISRYKLIADEIENRKERILEEQKKLNVINIELSRITDEIERLNNLIQDAKLDKEHKILLQKRDRLSKKIEEYEKKRKRLESEYKELSYKISDFVSKRKKIEKELEELREKRRSKEEELKELKDKKKELKDTIKIANTRIVELNKAIEELRENIGKIKTHIELHEKALYNITYGSIKCPLCGEGTLRRSDIERKISHLKNQENKVKNELFKLTKERNALLSIPDELNRINLLESNIRKEIEVLKNREEILLSEIDGYKDEFIRIYEERANKLQKDISNLTEIIDKYEKELNEVEREISSISEKLKQNVERLNDLRKKRNELQAKTEYIKEKIHNMSFLYIDDLKMNLEKAYEKVKLVTNILEKIEKYIRKEKLREENYAINLFNQQIGDILDKLEFKDLSVWIDAKSRDLHVVKNGVEFLPYRSLSESELYLIVTILTIAMKIAYTKDIPFLLIDELILSFDRRIYDAMIGLLRDLASKYNWCIIITRVGESEKIIQLLS